MSPPFLESSLKVVSLSRSSPSGNAAAASVSQRLRYWLGRALGKHQRGVGDVRPANKCKETSAWQTRTSCFSTATKSRCPYCTDRSMAPPQPASPSNARRPYRPSQIRSRCNTVPVSRWMVILRMDFESLRSATRNRSFICSTINYRHDFLVSGSRGRPNAVHVNRKDFFSRLQNVESRVGSALDESSRNK